MSASTEQIEALRARLADADPQLVFWRDKAAERALRITELECQLAVLRRALDDISERIEELTT